MRIGVFSTTLDDGPNCTHNVFYNYLAGQNQVTMFYIGSNVLGWLIEEQRALADGHEICARECFLFLALGFMTLTFFVV